MDNVGDWLYIVFLIIACRQWLIQFERQKEEESPRYIGATRQGNCA